MHSLKNGNGRSGFTLTELLVVIGIVALLFSILLPVIARAQAASRDSRCLGNLHQLGAAFEVYRNQYEALPAPAQTNTSKWWSQNYLYPIVYGKSPTAESLVNANWQPNTIFECPAAAGFDLPAGQTNLWRGYGMSARLNDRYADNGDYRMDFKRPNEVSNPAETCLLIDCTQPWSGTLVTTTPAPVNDQLQHVQDATVRHHNSLNVLYIDLHAAPRTFDSIPTVHAQGVWQTFWAGI